MARELSCFVIIPSNWKDKPLAAVADDRWGLSELPSSCATQPAAQHLDFDAIYENIIKQAIATVNQSSSDVHVRCMRGQDIPQSGDILRQVIEQICRADLTITDITTNNPNVFLEYGIRLSVRDSGNLLLCHESVGDKIPFNIGHLRAINYSTELTGSTKARNQIVRFIQSYVNEQTSPDRGKHDLYYEYVELYTGRLLEKRLIPMAHAAPALIVTLAEALFSDGAAGKEYRQQVFGYLMNYKEAIQVDPLDQVQVIEHLKLISKIRGLGQSRIRETFYALAEVCNADPKRKEEGALYLEEAKKLEE